MSAEERKLVAFILPLDGADGMFRIALQYQKNGVCDDFTSPIFTDSNKGKGYTFEEATLLEQLRNAGNNGADWLASAIRTAISETDHDPEQSPSIDWGRDDII